MATVYKAYKRPRRINAVSVSLLLIVAGAVYGGISAWPVVAQRADAQSALEDALPRLYRANLLPEPDATVAATKVQEMLVERLETLAIPDPNNALAVTRDSNIVAFDLRWGTAVKLAGTSYTFPIGLHTRAETSAARVSF